MDAKAIEITVAFFNFATAIVNIFWTFQIRIAKNDNDTIKDLKQSVKDKDDLLNDYEKNVERYKTQYHSLLNKFKHIDGRLKTYERLYPMSSEALEQANTITT